MGVGQTSFPVCLLIVTSRACDGKKAGKGNNWEKRERVKCLMEEGKKTREEPIFTKMFGLNPLFFINCHKHIHAGILQTNYLIHVISLKNFVQGYLAKAPKEREKGRRGGGHFFLLFLCWRVTTAAATSNSPKLVNNIKNGKNCLQINRLHIRHLLY